MLFTPRTAWCMVFPVGRASHRPSVTSSPPSRCKRSMHMLHWSVLISPSSLVASLLLVAEDCYYVEDEVASFFFWLFLARRRVPVAERGQINKDGSPESRQISGVRDCAVPWRRVVFEFRARFRPSSVRCIFTLPFLKSTAIPRVFSFLFSHRLSLPFSLRYKAL